MSFESDWIEISETKSAYTWNYDTPDFEGLIGLFTEDAVCKFGAYGTWTGVEEIRAGFEQNVSAPDNRFPTLHATTNPIIEIDEDRAKGKFILLDFVLTRDAGVMPNGVLGVYHDEFRKQGGRWRFSSIDLTFVWNSDVGRLRPGEEVKLDFHPDR
jgi:SnoaL-like domain